VLSKLFVFRFIFSIFRLKFCESITLSCKCKLRSTFVDDKLQLLCSFVCSISLSVVKHSRWCRQKTVVDDVTDRRHAVTRVIDYSNSDFRFCGIAKWTSCAVVSTWQVTDLPAANTVVPLAAASHHCELYRIQQVAWYYIDFVYLLRNTYRVAQKLAPLFVRLHFSKY